MSDISKAKPDERSIRIHSDRKTDVARFLIGKQPHQAVKLLPAIYSICANAHAGAAVVACSNRQMPEQQKIADRLVVLCENAREHLLRVFTTWGNHVHTNFAHIPFHVVMGLVAKMQAATGMDTHRPEARPKLSSKQVRQVASELDEFLKAHIFHSPPQQWLDMRNASQLEGWAQTVDTVAANFILHLYDQNWQSIGASQTRFLPEIPLAELAVRMHASDGDSFIAQPSWQGKPCETGPFARHQKHPLVNDLVNSYGSGILARQVARLVELANIPAQIEKLLETAQACKPSAPLADIGVGQVETARGQLTHSVIMTEGKIADYKILAPTEWNFHNDGVVHEALDNLQAKDCAETQKLAAMIVEAIDPCVDFEVRVH